MPPLPPPPGWKAAQLAKGASDDQVTATWKALTRPQRFDIQSKERGPSYVPTRGARSLCSPPEWWINQQRAVGMDERDMAKAWKALTKDQRMKIRSKEKHQAVRVAVVAARLAASKAEGKTNIRAELYIERGGNVMHETPEAAAAAHKESFVATNKRVSADRLQFRLKHAPGCSSDGCALAPEHDPMIVLVQHDHDDEKTKSGPTLKMAPPARDLEVKKTSPRCMMHHYLHTFVQCGHSAVEDRSTPAAVNLGKYKLEKGCQHPEHSNMPYAEMIDALKSQPQMAGLLEVSQVRLGSGGHNRSSITRKQQLKNCIEGMAVIHCAFCRRLYTVCEEAKLYQTACVQFFFNTLQDRHPKFVEHFEKCTDGFDWDRERSIRSKRKAQAAD